MSIKLSWENLDEIYGQGSRDDALYWKLCEQSTPSDFYFALNTSMDFEDDADEDGITFVAIVPKAYFKKEKSIWDQSMALGHILPEDVQEEMEGIYGCERSIEEVRKDLIARGFEENQDVFKAAGEY